MTSFTGNRGGSSNRRRFLKVAGTLATASVLAGCMGGDGGAGDGGGGDGGSTQTGTPQGVNSSQNEFGKPVGETFDDVRELAGQEDTMTVYGTIDREPFQEWIGAVQDEYPEVGVQHITGSAEPLYSRWRSEYQSDNVAASVFISGSNVKNTWTADPPQTMEINGDMMPSFEEIDDQFKDTNNNYWIAIRQILGHVHFNTDQVSQEDAGSWMDVVTNSAWSDQSIGWDPTPNMFLMSWLHETQGREFFEALRDQTPRFVDSHTDLARFAGAGEYPVAFTYTHKMGRFGGELPVDFFRFDSAPSSISPAIISNKAPEPNSAILFINFLASKAGQEFIGSAGEYVPYRADVEYAAWPPLWPPEGFEADVIPPDRDLEPTREMWNDVMGDLIG